jgi:hypothetical protein
MAGTTAVVLGIAAGVSALATAASAGLSFYGQQQQASAAQRMAEYNYAVQKAQMEMQNQMAYQQAQGQAAIFDYNARVAQNEAKRTEMEARERARRMRLENERALGAQRAAYGKAGVTSAGSPLMVMAETAGLGELAVSDELYKADAQRSGLYTQAALEQFKGRMARFEGSGYQWNAANAGAFAKPYLMQGMNEANALRMSSYGSLISGVGSAANSLSSMPMGGGGAGAGNTSDFGRYAQRFMPR